MYHKARSKRANKNSHINMGKRSCCDVYDRCWYFRTNEKKISVIILAKYPTTKMFMRFNQGKASVIQTVPKAGFMG